MVARDVGEYMFEKAGRARVQESRSSAGSPSGCGKPKKDDGTAISPTHIWYHAGD